MNDMQPLKNLLELPVNVNLNEEEKAKKIVSNLMCNYVIKKGDDLYEIIEAEFYYYDRSHKDITVYERDMEGGRFFFHQSGVDITFKSHIERVNENNGKIDSEKSYFGGILIRSLKRISKNNTSEFILGPMNCVNHLWADFNATERLVAEYPYLEHKTIEGASIEAEKRFYHVDDKQKKLKSLNSKFDKEVENDLDKWLDRKYRFVREDIKEDIKLSDALKNYRGRCPDAWK